MASLLGRKVGLLSFEYHGIGAWKTHRCARLAHFLSKQGLAPPCLTEVVAPPGGGHTRSHYPTCCGAG